MTRLLLSVSDILKKRLLFNRQEDIQRNVFNFFYALQALRMFTFLWLYWAVKKYMLLQQRPTDLFFFDHTLVSWLMPSFPSVSLFGSVISIAFMCNVWQLVSQKSNYFLQAILAVCLLWLNLPQWGYGFLSHVNYTFLLAHLFMIFIPVSRMSILHFNKHLHQSINWFYAGILFTYTLAGLWKIPILLYKLLTNSPDVHWLHPHASLFNAFVSYRNFDLNFVLTPLFTEYSLFWQISFIVVVYIQSVSIFAAFRQEMRPWSGLLLIIFHAMNMLVFETYFVVATFVIFCLFLPYDMLFRKHYKHVHTGCANSIFDAALPNPTPFEKLRLSTRSRSYYLSGPLYFPGLRSVANFFTDRETLIQSS